MKQLILYLTFVSVYVSYGQVTINPDPFEVDGQVTITVDINYNSPECNGFSNPTKVYLHSGIGSESNPWTYVIGNWGDDDGIGEMTDNGDGTWSITFIPKDYYGLTDQQAITVTRMGMVFRNETGAQEFKDFRNDNCEDFFFDVGAFQASLSTPDNLSTTILNSGESLNISATNTNGNANYTLKANDVILTSTNNTTTFSYTHTNIISNQEYELEVEQGGTTISKFFTAIINPGTTTEAMPSNLEDGINYDTNDNTKVTLVLDAPNKDFIYVAGSFNNWQPTSAYAMKKNTSGSKFWIDISGLNPGEDYTYQYWVGDASPISDSPNLVKTADPYSTLVLSPFDDPGIPASTYPNLPIYPDGQEREVTVIKTGQTPYVWQVNNFTPPVKEDLIIYEVLIRDFDSNRNFQDLIDRIDYFKDLNVNAIQLMPIMEYEGNESWGYNTSFHMALDKFYGTSDKFKEFVDLCHLNNIAVILDIALNHAYGRNPMVRMWMDDPDKDGWGEPSSENPYFNQVATHSYSVGSDFNHQQLRTQYYVERVVKHWIEEYKIDGFRWDLTKGFTQNCTNNESCTNNYQQDRVDILKQYANYSWSLDPDHFVIFEHLGQDSEEQQWANYLINEGKGIMLWGKMTDQYNQLTMGFASNANINRVGHNSRGFNAPRLVGYAESHDEERLMYKNLQFGNSALSTHNVRELNVALSRMSALGAALLTVPGPKMIWHFGALGMENSIYTCTNGSVNTEDDATPGNCKLDTKPQPQWMNNLLADSNRVQIYNDWARLNELKINEEVFEAGNYSISPYINDIRQRIYVWDDSLPGSELKNVVVLCNFSVADLPVQGDFPYTGTWYDLMDPTGNTIISVNSTDQQINIPAGQFRIFGNQPSTLSSDDFNLTDTISVYPNPTNSSFSISTSVSNLIIFDLTGKKVKEFSGDFQSGHLFNISNLTKSMYLVQIKNNSGAIKTTKLVKL